MTFEEAKKILEKEGFYVEKATRPCSISESFIEYEDPTICEAMQVVNSSGYFVCMEMSCFDERKARLKKELAEHSNAPVSGKEKAKEGNPALKEAASRFNDALLDEQAKKIAELTKEKTNLEDQITILNACKEYNENFGRKQIKRLGKEISKLNGIIHDKNAVLADVAEELRLSKIREKNLAELGLKYVGENEELKKELADKVVDKIDAQALKSAESALEWKEKAITYKDMAIAYNEKMIADLQEKLASTKKELEGANNLVEIVRKGSKEYCEYGIAAEKMIQKMAKDIVDDRPVSSKDYEQYRLWAKGYRFNPHLPERTDEEEKKLNTSKSTLDDLKEKAYESFNAKAHKLGPVGSKDGNGIIDQMVGADFAEEGADLCGVIVLCGKDFIDALKNVKDVWQE